MTQLSEELLALAKGLERADRLGESDQRGVANSLRRLAAAIEPAKRDTHAYRLNGIGTPRESLLHVQVMIDGQPRALSVQAARELAEDLLSAAKDADDRAAEVRESLMGYA